MKRKTAVIHTTPVTIPVISKLAEKYCGGMEIVNLLDDSMLAEINRAGGITEGVKYRLNTLLVIAQSMKADCVFCACSSIGGAFEEGGELLSIPVLRIDEPMAQQAAQYARVGVAATLQSTLGPTTELIRRKALQAGREVRIETQVIEGAGALLTQGRGEEYDRIVGERLRSLGEKNEVVVLAQASMARAVEGFEREERKRFLTSPDSGVRALGEMFV